MNVHSEIIEFDQFETWTNKRFPLKISKVFGCSDIKKDIGLVIADAPWTDAIRNPFYTMLSQLIVKEVWIPVFTTIKDGMFIENWTAQSREEYVPFSIEQLTNNSILLRKYLEEIWYKKIITITQSIALWFYAYAQNRLWITKDSVVSMLPASLDHHAFSEFKRAYHLNDNEEVIQSYITNDKLIVSEDEIICMNPKNRKRKDMNSEIENLTVENFYWILNPYDKLLNTEFYNSLSNINTLDSSAFFPVSQITQVQDRWLDIWHSYWDKRDVAVNLIVKAIREITSK